MKKTILSVIIATPILLGLGLSTKASALSIKNINEYEDEYASVAVSSWADDASYDFYDIGPKGYESWDREDSRGVLMVSNLDHKTYYMKSGASLMMQGSEYKDTYWGTVATPIDASMKQGSDNHINVKNNAGTTYKASISKWNHNDSGSFYTINKGDSETWSRDDWRGYVLAVEKEDLPIPRYYYMKTGNTAIIDNRGIPEVNGQELPQISQFG